MNKRTFSIRPYIGSEKLRIDGRTIPYPLVTAGDYLMAKNPSMTDEELETYVDEKYEQYTSLNAIIAMKQSCFLLRHTEYSCGSLSDDLFRVKGLMVAAHNEKYPDEPFDENFYEHYIDHISKVCEKLSDIDYSDMKTPMCVVYEHPMDFPDRYVVRLLDMFDGHVAITNTVIVRDSLEDCRREITENGFTVFFPRSPGDDACIVETWLR